VTKQSYTYTHYAHKTIATQQQHHNTRQQQCSDQTTTTKQSCMHTFECARDGFVCVCARWHLCVCAMALFACVRDGFCVCARWLKTMAKCQGSAISVAQSSRAISVAQSSRAISVEQSSRAIRTCHAHPRRAHQPGPRATIPSRLGFKV